MGPKPRHFVSEYLAHFHLQTDSTLGALFLVVLDVNFMGTMFHKNDVSG